MRSYYYLEHIEKYISKLENETNLKDDELKGYLSACEKIKIKVKQEINSAISDSIED